jgi:hypothetical protein
MKETDFITTPESPVNTVGELIEFLKEFAAKYGSDCGLIVGGKQSVRIVRTGLSTTLEGDGAEAEL